MRRQESAQSLIELSLYGMVILSLLGVVLSYGMRYNFRQSADQRSFRKAMAAAQGHMGSKTYVLLHDRSVPNPQDTFGTGQAAPYISTTTLLRDYLTLTTWDVGDDAMPTLTIGHESRVGETTEDHFTIAGEYTYCWPAGSCNHRFARRKYAEILGENNVQRDGNCVHVLDWCGGEIFGYEGCKRQCRMITEQDYCVRQCRETRLYNDDACEDICAADVPAFWYCDSLDSFFAFTGSSDTRNWNAGLQARTVIESTRSETSTKNESPGGIASSDTLAHSDNVQRWVVYRPVGSGSPATTQIDNVVDREPTVSMNEGW